MLTAKNIDSVISLLQNAGREILRIYRMDDFRTRLKEDLSPVTMADLASDKIIKAGLKKITPEIPVFSEETKEVDYSIRSCRETLWILDPLDGTKEFVSRNNEFCISLALITRNSPAAGFIYSPVLKTSWYAIRGEGAFRVIDGVKTKMPISLTTGPYRINISRNHHSSKESEWIGKFSKNFKSSVEIQGSAIKFCKIAEGASDIYPKFSLIHEWDIAAGHIIIEESGGRIVEQATGKPPVYNKENYHQPPFVAYGKRVAESGIKPFELP